MNRKDRAVWLLGVSSAAALYALGLSPAGPSTPNLWGLVCTAPLVIASYAMLGLAGESNPGADRRYRYLEWFMAVGLVAGALCYAIG